MPCWKELLLAADDPRRAAWAELTAACESVGLFDDPQRIGDRRQWAHLVRERGYRLVDHALVPVGNEEGTDTEADPEDAASAGPDGWSAARHRTALSRYGFSTPIQSLARNGLLDGAHSLFDYIQCKASSTRSAVAAWSTQRSNVSSSAVSMRWRMCFGSVPKRRSRNRTRARASPC